MSWADTMKLTSIEGAGFVTLIAYTATGSTLTSITAVDSTNSPLVFNAVASAPNPTLADSAKAASAEYITKELSNGVTLEVPKRTLKIDQSGAEKTTSGGSNSGDSVEITVLDVDITKFKKLQLCKEEPVSVVFNIGEDVSEGNMGYAHLLGKMSGLTWKPSGNNFGEVSFKVTGGETFTSSVTYSTYNSNAATSNLPIGGSALTVKALTSDEYTALLKGNFVFTAAT